MIGWFACFHGFCRTGEFGHPLEARDQWTGRDQWRGEITSPDAGGAARACFSPLCLHPGVCWRCSLVLTAHPLTDWLWPGLGLGARSRARPGPGLSSADHSPALVTSRHSPELGFQSVVPSLLSLKPVISSALPLVSWHRTAHFLHCITILNLFFEHFSLSLDLFAVKWIVFLLNGAIVDCRRVLCFYVNCVLMPCNWPRR